MMTRGVKIFFKKNSFFGFRSIGPKNIVIFPNLNTTMALGEPDFFSHPLYPKGIIKVNVTSILGYMQ